MKKWIILMAIVAVSKSAHSQEIIATVKSSYRYIPNTTVSVPNYAAAVNTIILNFSLVAIKNCNEKFNKDVESKLWQARSQINKVTKYYLVASRDCCCIKTLVKADDQPRLWDANDKIQIIELLPLFKWEGRLY